MINNKIKLHILGVPVNKFGNWLKIILKFVDKTHLIINKASNQFSTVCGHCVSPINQFIQPTVQQQKMNINKTM